MDKEVEEKLNTILKNQKDLAKNQAVIEKDNFAYAVGLAILIAAASLGIITLITSAS